MTSTNAPSPTFDASAMELYDFHQSMLFDRVRMEAFKNAVEGVVRPGDVVVEIGCGTGILAATAARAGAAKVYAIESDEIIDVARAVASANGLTDQIEFIAALSTEVDLPKLGDVLITETIGNAGFDEGILVWVADARDRLLKPHAKVIPRRITLQAALLELPTDHAEVDRLLEPLNGFDLSPLRELVVNRLGWEVLSPVSVVSAHRDLYTADLDEPATSFECVAQLTARRDATVHGVGLWFDAVIGDGIKLSNAPPNPAPSWNQGLYMLDKPITMQKGDQIELGLSVEGGGDWVLKVERRSKG